VGKDVVDLLQELVGCVISIVDNWIKVREVYWQFVSLKELVEMLPVVHFLIFVQSIVVLVHFNIVWVVFGKDLSEDPTVGKISFRVDYLVCQVQRLEP